MIKNNDFTESSINERVKYIIDCFFDGNTSAMARCIPVKQSTLRDIIGERQSVPSYETLKGIVDSALNISSNWLITGKGEMFKSEQPTPTLQEEGTPLLPVEAWGGSLSGSSIAVLAEQCKKYTVPISNIDYLIPIAGDSMMPDYCPGDVVAIKKVNEKAFIEWGKVYVLDTCNGVVIKEVQPSATDGCITCISHNMPERYRPFEVCLDPVDFYGMYAVKGTVRIS